jgi:exonuclease SbcC
MIFFKQITVEGFRGIPNRITLDLSSPITVVYAANGVGKTTLCDAAEWLLTDSIKRIQNVGGGEQDYQCQFRQDGYDTKVAGTLSVYGDVVTLQRTLTSCRWSIGNESLRAVTLSALLEKLAPSAAQEGVHRGHANNSRQIWLRGTRFLSGESLGALLDADEVSVENRERLFADLLGVGHLLETERQLETYLAALRPYLRDKQTLYDSAVDALRDHQSRMGYEQQLKEETLLPVAIDKLSDAGASLGETYVLPDKTGASASDISRAIAVIRADLAKRKAAWNERRQAEIQLAADWPARSVLLQEHATDQDRMTVLARSTSELGARVEAIRTQVDAIDQRQRDVRQAVINLHDRCLRLDTSLAYVQPLLTHFLIVANQRNLLGHAAFRLVDEAGSEASRSTAAARFRALREQLSARRAEQDELALLKEQEAAARSQLLTTDILEQTSTALTNAENLEAVIRGQYERVAGPLEQLRHIVSTVAGLLEQERECPVCRHDWGTPESLHSALQVATSSTPQNLLDLGSRLKGAEDNVRALQADLARNRVISDTLRRLNARINSLEDAQTAFAARASEVGLSDDGADLAQQIEVGIARLTLIDGLKRLQDEVKGIEAATKISAPREVTIPSLGEYLRNEIEKQSDSLNIMLQELGQQRERISGAPEIMWHAPRCI